MKKEILLDIYEGWFYYREMLNTIKDLKGNQINTWNAQWLVHRYDKRTFQRNKPLSGLNILKPASKANSKEIMMTSWTKVLISIARQWEESRMMSYIYNFGQTNSTYGFIPLYLEHIRRPVQLYEKIFSIDEGRSAESLWGDSKGLRFLCQVGYIGLKAMEPKDLRNAWRENINIVYNERNKLKFNTYKIWLMAILNNQELWDKAAEFAAIIRDYLRNNRNTISTERKNRVDNLLASRNKKLFVDAASELMDDASISEKLIDIVKLVHMMPNDNVPYFISLVRFNKLAIDNQ